MTPNGVDYLLFSYIRLLAYFLILFYTVLLFYTILLFFTPLIFLQADQLRQLSSATDAPVTPPQAEAQGTTLAQKLAAGLRELATKVEAQPELLSKAADLMSLDFMDNRAPPSEVRTHNLSRFCALPEP